MIVWDDLKVGSLVILIWNWALGAINLFWANWPGQNLTHLPLAQSTIMVIKHAKNNLR